ncbi:GntR family phosphonate transport system transcriptional regulator [Angulomicrobium tetraedrale]|uniref:GntR family phosphonate transport system transcriptional regulator n=1 Tax=Ancylobacter tetraedralis TaxID=217068 RepID=A0A839Z5D2_9HYPH|nr:phosphonate metabolism transcriptional regulator PhnF [Ancylobacter tetraedralis]MBB3769446.1 GntR family phosphonate transport system transcriptional regulator [Ancylobacter tetraedralis]
MASPPLWQRVQFELEKRIRSGSLAEGAPLPSEEQLAASFGVHRNTVRRALARLHEKELIRIVHGRGASVAVPRVTYRLARTARMTSVLQWSGHSPKRRILSATETRAERPVAAGLMLPSGHPVVRVRTLCTMDGRPVSLTVSSYPLPRLNGIVGMIEDAGSIAEAMQRLGIAKVSRHEMHLRACLPSEPEARELGISRGRPIMELVTVDSDPSGIPVQHVVTKILSDYFDFVISPSE